MADLYFLAFKKTPFWPVRVNDYVIQPTAAPQRPEPPPLPDISGFTMDAMIAKIPPAKPIKVHVDKIAEYEGFDKFTEARREAEFIRLQKRDKPLAIIVDSGVGTLEDVAAAVNNPEYIAVNPDGIFNLYVPLYVAGGATLIIRGTPEQPLVLRLSALRGAFLVNAGNMFMIDSEIAGWNEEKNDYAHFESSSTFRPFIASWSGSDTYMGRSLFSDLGYSASKSYGVTFSSTKAFIKKNPSIAKPKGWIIDSTIRRTYYGFYCYEADHIAIINNVYDDNIVYGIDPHDYSKHLIIARNTASRTRQRHGIIGSREVTDSWIFDNVTFNNAGSGIMLDRTSVRNVVANNLSYGNKSDGLTLFESQDNLVYGNTLIWNGKNGLRLRNSWNVDAWDNLIAFNGSTGVQVYTAHLTKDEVERDFDLDPFTRRASLNLIDSGVFLNKRGGFKIDEAEKVILSDIEFLFYNRILMRGAVDDAVRDIGVGLRRSPYTIEIKNPKLMPAP